MSTGGAGIRNGVVVRGCNCKKRNGLSYDCRCPKPEQGDASSAMAMQVGEGCPCPGVDDLIKMGQDRLNQGENGRTQNQPVFAQTLDGSVVALGNQNQLQQSNQNQNENWAQNNNVYQDASGYNQANVPMGDGAMGYNVYAQGQPRGMMPHNAQMDTAGGTFHPGYSASSGYNGSPGNPAESQGNFPNNPGFQTGHPMQGAMGINQNQGNIQNNPGYNPAMEVQNSGQEHVNANQNPANFNQSQGINNPGNYAMAGGNQGHVPGHGNPGVGFHTGPGVGNDMNQMGYGNATATGNPTNNSDAQGHNAMVVGNPGQFNNNEGSFAPSPMAQGNIAPVGNPGDNAFVHGNMGNVGYAPPNSVPDGFLTQGNTQMNSMGNPGAAVHGFNDPMAMSNPGNYVSQGLQQTAQNPMGVMNQMGGQGMNPAMGNPCPHHGHGMANSPHQHGYSGNTYSQAQMHPNQYAGGDVHQTFNNQAYGYQPKVNPSMQMGYQ